MTALLYGPVPALLTAVGSRFEMMVLVFPFAVTLAIAISTLGTEVENIAKCAAVNRD